MASKNSEMEPTRRGRPRAYDAEAALKRATDEFWQTGYSGTSLDSIAAATGMNPPSLYAAFGNKRAITPPQLCQVLDQQAARHFGIC
jgi:TetR/AcrR family transcriptional regulator, copper-responsive repressor